MLEYRRYYLRELRQEMAEVITSWIPQEELMAIPFGRYIMNELWRNEENERESFRRPFTGVMPVFTDYTLLFQMWTLLYRVQYFYLYFPHHRLVNRVIDTIRPTIDPQEVNETVSLLFTISKSNAGLFPRPRYEKTESFNYFAPQEAYSVVQE